MKKILLMLFIMGFTANVAHAQSYGWVALNPASIPGTPNLSDLFFINADTGWINSNTVNSTFYTEDGAGSFVTQAIETTIDAIHILDANNGYAAADDGSIYRTTEGGTNWNFLASTFVNLNDITFPRTGSTATGYACGDNGAIYSVTSLGADVMTSGSISNLQSITFPTDTEGWVCGQAIIRHFAGGIWQAGQTYPSGTYNAIYFTDNKKGWAIGTKIIHTTDGQNWIAQTNPDPLGRTLVDLFFLNENEGWIVGNQGLILHTSNGGTNWTVEANGLTSALLTGVHFTSSTNGYVVGNNKTLLKYTLLTSIEDETTQHAKFKLEQNYPNPFAETTTISWQQPEKAHVVLKVCDFTGREVKTLVDSEKPMGEHSVKFEAASLPAGVYFIRFKAGNHTATGKMILIN